MIQGPFIHHNIILLAGRCKQYEESIFMLDDTVATTVHSSVDN